MYMMSSNLGSVHTLQPGYDKHHDNTSAERKADRRRVRIGLLMDEVCMIQCGECWHKIQNKE